MASKKEDKITTIRLKESTKTNLADLDFVKKGMSYEEILNHLIVKYKEEQKK